jgi:hypothetical protein
MHHAYTHSFPAPVVPFLALTGAADTIAPYAMTWDFYQAAASIEHRGFVNKLMANHFEPNSAMTNGGLIIYSVAWFKLYLDKVEQEAGFDYHKLIYGTDSLDLCHGGDGAMAYCKVQ